TCSIGGRTGGETYALGRDIVAGEELRPISMEGISRAGVAYAVNGILRKGGATITVLNEHHTGLDFYLQANMIDAPNAGHVRKVLQDALDALDKNVPAKPASAPAGATAPADS